MKSCPDRGELVLACSSPEVRPRREPPPVERREAPLCFRAFPALRSLIRGSKKRRRRPSAEPIQGADDARLYESPTIESENRSRADAARLPSPGGGGSTA